MLIVDGFLTLFAISIHAGGPLDPKTGLGRLQPGALDAAVHEDVPSYPDLVDSGPPLDPKTGLGRLQPGALDTAVREDVVAEAQISGTVPQGYQLDRHTTYDRLNRHSTWMIS